METVVRLSYNQSHEIGPAPRPTRARRTCARAAADQAWRAGSRRLFALPCLFGVSPASRLPPHVPPTRPPPAPRPERAAASRAMPAIPPRRRARARRSYCLGSSNWLLASATLRVAVFGASSMLPQLELQRHTLPELQRHPRPLQLRSLQAPHSPAAPRPDPYRFPARAAQSPWLSRSRRAACCRCFCSPAGGSRGSLTGGADRGGAGLNLWAQRVDVAIVGDLLPLDRAPAPAPPGARDPPGAAWPLDAIVQGVAQEARTPRAPPRAPARPRVRASAVLCAPRALSLHVRAAPLCADPLP